MSKLNIKSKKGFTIIEVVLVLAIAGLIFLMVFVALPALQRSQRDTQRRNDMARFISQIAQYQTNNNGQVPKDYDKFIDDYLQAGGDTFNDPSTGNSYAIAEEIGECFDDDNGCAPDVDGTIGVINVYTNAVCKGEAPSPADQDKTLANKIAIVLKLEGAGYYCGNN